MIMSETDLLSVNVTVFWHSAEPGAEWNNLGMCQVSVYHNQTKNSYRFVGWNDVNEVRFWFV